MKNIKLMVPFKIKLVLPYPQKALVHFDLRILITH